MNEEREKSKETKTRIRKAKGQEKEKEKSQKSPPLHASGSTDISGPGHAVGSAPGPERPKHDTMRPETDRSHPAARVSNSRFPDVSSAVIQLEVTGC